MAILKNSKVGCICIGRTCASSNGERTVRLGGCCAGDGAQKTAVGYKSGYDSSGAQNTSFGVRALQCNTGACNTGIGGNVMENGTGNCNTAVGHNALRCNSSGGCNTGVGYKSLFSLNTGTRNTGVGMYSGRSITSGDKNTFIGYYANANAGNRTQTVAIGTSSTAGANYAVAIGDNACANGTCAIAIGANACVGANKIAWGSSVNNQCNCVWGTWSYISDCRDKADITDLDDNLGINFIRKLKPVKYNIDNRQSYVQLCNYQYGTKDGNLKRERKSYGLIAQEVKDAADELNIQFEGIKYNEDKDAYRLSYSQLLASIVKTIKSVDERIQILKTKI